MLDKSDIIAEVLLVGSTFELILWLINAISLSWRCFAMLVIFTLWAQHVTFFRG